MGTTAIDQSHSIAGQRYSGKLPVFRCKPCGATFIEPETERDFFTTVARVADGTVPEHANIFRIHRESTVAKRNFWSAWFGGHRAANDVERGRRGEAR